MAGTARRAPPVAYDLIAVGLPEVALAFGVGELSGDSLPGELDELVVIEGPDSCRSIGPVRRQPSAVRAKGHAVHAAGVAEQRRLLLASDRIPDADRSVTARGGDSRAVAAEDELVDETGVTGKCADARTGVQVPDRDGLVGR